MLPRRSFMTFAAALAVLVSGPATASESILSGTVTYLDRSALPPGAVLDVELADVSRADAASVPISSRRFAIDRVPFPFSLKYDASKIAEQSDYAVSARISVDAQVIYRSTTRYPVLTGGAPHSVEMVLERMAGTDEAALDGSAWVVTELGGQQPAGERRPAIRFLPDGTAAIDTGCNRFSGPVEISGDSIRFSDRMVGTMMACPPPLDRQERDMLARLAQATGFERVDESLLLTDAAGDTVMRLTPAE